MQLTDPNGPMSLQPRRTGLGRNSLAGRLAASAILFLSSATFVATVSRAQDQQDPKPQQDQSVAEAARQERARKQEKQKTAKHVYTEEDLKHPNILTPEDRAQIEAKRNECAQKNNCSPAPSQNPPATLDANSPAPGTSLIPGTSLGTAISLGEVARQLRKQKELEALKPKQTEPFHLPTDAPVFASPILPGLLPIQPLAQPARPKISSPELLSPRIPSRKIPSAKSPANIFRRDPFSGMPAPPELRQPEVARPEVARPKMNGEVHPKLRAKVAPKLGDSLDLKTSADVGAKIGDALLPTVPPTRVRPDFGEVVRPALRARKPLTSLAQPKISSPLATKKIFSQPIVAPAPVAPVQPAAPVSKAVQPAAPASAIRPATKSVVATPAQPVAPSATVSPVQPKAVPPAPILTQHTVSVQHGDSLWKLAQENLGRGNRWPELAAANPGIVNPNEIRAGAQLNLPVAAASPIRRSAKTDSGTIQVRKGDTLWSLAKANLGRSAAWPCLAAANPSLADPNRIFEGQELVVPAACHSARASAPSATHSN
jgi:nucleoid-associated protein YgaU